MRVLGIDPGSTVTAWGLVETARGRLVHLDSGSVRTSSERPIAERLVTIHEAVGSVLDRHRPDTVAIEAIFRHKSSESALRLGQARGVALLAIGQRGYVPAEYNPMQVKSAVGAHGRADKEAIARMVCLLLGIRVEGPYDVTDALAIAITHAAHSRVAALRTA